MATKLMIYTVDDGNGNQYDIEGPEGATPEQLQAAVAGGQVSPNEAPVQPSSENLSSIFDRRLAEAQGERPGLDPVNTFGGDNPFIGNTGIPNPLHTLQSGADLVARGGEYLGAGVNTGLEAMDNLAESTGLADALSVDGNKFLPGSAIGALGEAFPLGGIEAGLAPVSGMMSKGGRNKLAVEGNAIFEAGATVQEMQDWARANKLNPFDEAELSTAVKARDEGFATRGVRNTEEGLAVDAMEDTLSNEAKAFQDKKAQAPVDPLEQEAQAFKGKKEPTADDLFPNEEKVAATEAGMEARLQAEADAFRNRGNEPTVDSFVERIKGGDKIESPEDLQFYENNAEAIEAKLKGDTPEPTAISQSESEVVTAIRDEVTSITAKWANAPEVDVLDTFDGVEGFDPNAIGATTPEGRVVLNSKAILEEAADTGVSPRDIISAVTFHEGLGHHGLAQKFGVELDGFLENLYDKSRKFKADVDAWRAKNPDYYEADLNPLARAAEEVLAEMSEKGRISPTVYGRIRNKLKEFAREIGIDLDFSIGEIRTILGMAHDAVVKGMGRDVPSNGFRNRFMRAAPKPANDNKLRAPETPAYKASDEEWADYYKKSEEYHLRKALEAEQKGNVSRADNYRHRAKLDLRSAQRRDPERHGVPTSSGSAKFFREQADYYQKKMDERATRGDAKGVERYRMFRDDAATRASSNAQESLGNRFMNSTVAALQRDADALDLDGSGNGVERRTMRRAQSQAATAELNKTPKGETRSVQPFPDEEPDYWRFHHTTDDGETISGFYHVEDGALTDFNINSAKGPAGFGPSVVRKIARSLLDKHPEATRIQGYRISGARVKGAGKSPFDADFVQSGSRFMKKRSAGRGSDGPLQGPGSREGRGEFEAISKFRSNRNLEEISKETPISKTFQSWDDTIEAAGNIKMTTKKAENLGLDASIPEVKAAEVFLLESRNRIYDLSKKVAEGFATEREKYLLGQEIERHDRISQSIYDVVSHWGRGLNSRKIEVASEKALSDSIRRMLRSVEKKDLQTPEGIEKVAKLLAKGNPRAKAVSKGLDILSNALNLPRSVMSSMDLSAPLRQGIFMIGRKELWKGIPGMFKQFGSETAYNAVMADIKSRPRYQLMEDSGLSIADLGGRLVDREERFISTWAEKIPLAGRGIRASERAYTGFLNKLRADVFDSIAQKYEDAGVDLKSFSKNTRDISRFINNATGRGDLGKFNQAAPALSGIFFSPRLLASRVHMLNPWEYYKLDPIVRKEALKSLASFGGIAATTAMLAKLAGADVETDPRSSDFAKVKVGNTRYDILGGFGQYLTLGARVQQNEKKNAKGEVVELGKKYGSDDFTDVIKDFGLNKFSPLASFVVDWRRGKDAIGQPFELQKAVISRFIPLFLQDATELIKEEGAVGIPMSLPGLFGVGINTYDVNLGFDAFGRDVKTLLKEKKPETDPVAIEIARLNTTAKNPPLTAAPNSFSEGGVKYPLDEDQKNEFQRIMGDLQHQFLSEDITSEDWINGSDEDRVEIAKKAHQDAYQQTKEYFLDNVFPETAEVPLGMVESFNDEGDDNGGN